MNTIKSNIGFVIIAICFFQFSSCKRVSKIEKTYYNILLDSRKIHRIDILNKGNIIYADPPSDEQKTDMVKYYLPGSLSQKDLKKALRIIKNSKHLKICYKYPNYHHADSIMLMTYPNKLKEMCFSDFYHHLRKGNIAKVSLENGYFHVYLVTKQHYLIKGPQSKMVMKYIKSKWVKIFTLKRSWRNQPKKR